MLAACSEGDESVQRVLPSAVPADLVGEATRYEFSEAPNAASFTILGLAGEEPFGARDAVVELVWRLGETEVDDDTTVRDGRPADVEELTVPGGRSASVTWIEDSMQVTVRSRTLDADALLPVVEALEIDGREIDVADDIGLEVVGVVPLPIYDSGYSVDYGEGERYLRVDVHPASGDEMLLYAWGPTEPATIDGRQVLRLLADKGAVPGYVLEYAPGLIVRIEGSVTDDELRAAVSSLEPITDVELASIAREQ